jgi:hypothetical protein
MIDDDGVALANIKHPRSRFWWLTWPWFWLFPPKINPGAIETVEIELRPSKGGLLNNSGNKDAK